MQVPVEPSHVPWFEQVLSPGHFISEDINLLFHLTFIKKIKDFTLTHISLNSWSTSASSSWDITDTLVWAIIRPKALYFYIYWYIISSYIGTFVALRKFLPWHVSPWNPKSQTHVPVGISQTPWFVQSPDPKHCNSIKFNILSHLT